MKIICMGHGEDKCGKLLGYKQPLNDDSVTHGLCPKCAAAYDKDIDAMPGREILGESPLNLK